MTESAALKRTIADPAAATGSDDSINAAFEAAFNDIKERIENALF